MTKFGVLIIGVFLIVISCSTQEDNIVLPQSSQKYQTDNVVIIVIDGPRMIDTWAKNGAIPNQKRLAKEGVLFTNFFNDGETYTLSGHTAITTGSYENVNNDGSEFPEFPSIFQSYLAENQLPPESSAIIASKSKLHALSNSKDLNWKDSYSPYVDAKDRYDSTTLKASLELLENKHPRLSLIHFRGPDKNGHAANWDAYLESISNTDIYVNDIWNFLQTDTLYKNKTALFITNDHGRHLDAIGTGFKGHGDRCEGCRHIALLALGPDFPDNMIVEKSYGQIDIAPTVAQILNFQWRGQGEVITELINN